MQGAVRIIMDYGHAPKNTTLTTFQIKKWGAGKKKNKHNNLRVTKEPLQKCLPMYILIEELKKPILKPLYIELFGDEFEGAHG